LEWKSHNADERETFLARAFNLAIALSDVFPAVGSRWPIRALAAFAGRRPTALLPAKKAISAKWPIEWLSLRPNLGLPK
jgi:hypothetical protein